MIDICIKCKDNKNIYSKDIIEQINLSCLNHGLDGIESLKDVPSNLFRNILLDVGLNYFRNLNILKDNNNIRKYDIDKLYIISDLYIYLCNEYDKIISINIFMDFCGIDSDNFYSDDDALNRALCRLDKKFDLNDNYLQKVKARDSKQSILNLAYNNYRHNWSGTIKAQETRETVKSLADISGKLSLVDGQKDD